MISVHLMHSQTLVRQGLSKLLRGIPGFDMGGESQTVAELERIKDGLRVSVILMAVTVPDLRSINFREIKDSTGAKILVITRLEDGVCPSNAIQSGADGFMLEDACLDEIVFAIKYVTQDKKYLSSAIGFALQKHAPPGLSSAKGIKLSSREIEILHLMGEGLTNQEIAEKTFTSKRTVEGHRNHLLQKTGTRNTAALMKYVMLGNVVNYKLSDSSPRLTG